MQDLFALNSMALVKHVEERRIINYIVNYVFFLILVLIINT